MNKIIVIKPVIYIFLMKTTWYTLALVYNNLHSLTFMYTCTEHNVTIHSILRLSQLSQPEAQVQNQPSLSSKRPIPTSLCKDSNQDHQCSAKKVQSNDFTTMLNTCASLCSTRRVSIAK